MSAMALLGVSFSSSALVREKTQPFVPFYFSTETMGNTFGVAGVARGCLATAALFGMALYSDKDSYVGFLSAF